VGTGVPDLSTLADARSETISATLLTRRQEFELQPFEIRALRETVVYLKVENPRFLFLEGSTDAVAAAGGAAAALPDASATCADASVARTASSVDRLVAAAPGACSSAASAALGEGAQAPTSQGACPPSLSSSSPSTDDEYSEVARGESPCCSRCQNSSSLRSRRSHRRILRSFFHAARSYSSHCVARVCSSSGRGRIGPRGVHGHPLLGRLKCQSRDGVVEESRKRGRAHSPAGRREA
jgi:hypothetical protein